MKRAQVAFAVWAALTAALLGANGGESNALSSHGKTFDNWMFTTRAYNEEALRLVIQEANRVAVDLKLSEKLPITETNILECYITPYAMRRHTFGAIGNITTSNYIYCVSIDGKFSYLIKRHEDADRAKWAAEYSQAVSQLDPETGQQLFNTNLAFQLLQTNAAYQLATQWLADASMDVNGLNRDLTCYIHTPLIWGSHGELRFLPVYSVCWKKGPDGPEGEAGKAAVDLFLPTKTLLQLSMRDSKYILRKPLHFTNIDMLLSPTNSGKQ